MGGGDLNLKKSWHPLTMRNQERVWKEEQKALEEKKKLAQLTKELAEERAKQELRELQEEAGLLQKSSRIEWMYSGPSCGGMPSQSILDQEREDYLLGRKRAESFMDGATSSSVTSGASALQHPKATGFEVSQRDIMNKVREDPLFMVRQKEQQALKMIMSNPLQIKKLKSSMDLASPSTPSESDKHKKHKKHKKRKKHIHSSTSSTSAPVQNDEHTSTIHRSDPFPSIDALLHRPPASSRRSSRSPSSRHSSRSMGHHRDRGQLEDRGRDRVSEKLRYRSRSPHSTSRRRERSRDEGRPIPRSEAGSSSKSSSHRR